MQLIIDFDLTTLMNSLGRPGRSEWPLDIDELVAELPALLPGSNPGNAGI